MKVKITLIVMQYNKNVHHTNKNYVKVYFAEDNLFPSVIASTKTETETLKCVCENHFKIGFEWFEKQLCDFRIVNNHGQMTAETVYIIHTPEIIDSIKNGRFLSFSQIHESGIELEPFYERAITGTAKPIFR